MINASAWKEPVRCDAVNTVHGNNARNTETTIVLAVNTFLQKKHLVIIHAFF